MAAPLIVYDRADAAAKSEASQLEFLTALDRAMAAFAHERRGSGLGHDSVLDLVLSAPDMFGLAPDAGEDAAAEYLLGLLDADPHAEVILLTPSTLRRDEYRFAPEYGESTDDNWVFRIRLPDTLNVLIWSIVPYEGAAYAYAIE